MRGRKEKRRVVRDQRVRTRGENLSVGQPSDRRSLDRPKQAPNTSGPHIDTTLERRAIPRELSGDQYAPRRQLAEGRDRPIQSPKPPGAPTDFNNNGRLDFDGIEYEQLPDRLYIDSFIAVVGSGLALINLTGTDQDINTVLFSVWNDFEVPLSATLQFNCWFDQPLANISTLFTQGFLAGTPNDPDELDINCDGVDDFETGWASIQSLGVRNPGGLLISPDGALLGALTTGIGGINGGRLLAESRTKQENGSF